MRATFWGGLERIKNARTRFVDEVPSDLKVVQHSYILHLDIAVMSDNNITDNVVSSFPLSSSPPPPLCQLCVCQ